MCLRFGRSGGQDITYTNQDIYSYVNSRCYNFSKPKITRSTYLQFHRELHYYYYYYYYSADSTPIHKNKLFTSSYMNYLCNVERVPTEFLGLLEGHYLNVECPWGELSLCDSIVQVTCSVVWVGAGEFCSSCWCQVLDTLVSLQIAMGKAIDQLRTARMHVCYDIKILLLYISGSKANFLLQTGGS
jgi:hypothetical protein